MLLDRTLTFCGFLAFLSLCGCGQRDSAQGNSSGKTSVVVYSPHGPEIAQAVKEAFESKYPLYDLKVLVMSGGTIRTRIAGERALPRCDVWWGGAQTDFMQAARDDLLESYRPDWIGQLPPNAYDRETRWLGMYYTPQGIMFNTQKVKVEEIPQDWDGLIEPLWKGRIAIRDVRPSATMRINFCAQIFRIIHQKKGREADGYDWLRKLHENTGAYAGNPNLLYETLQADNALALTIWNQVDALLQRSKGAPFDFVIPRPSILLLEPIAAIKNAPNPVGARMFIDFVNAHEQLIEHANRFHRLPVRLDIPQDKLPEWMRTLKLIPLMLDWDELSRNQERWLDWWQNEIKAR